MITDDRPVLIEVAAGRGNLTSGDAVSVGLIVTEGLLNALKHAFPPDKKDGRIVVAYKADGTGWTLSIADNGIGKPSESSVFAKAGLGTSIVDALAQQLHARVDVASGPGGTTLSIIHASAIEQLTQAA
jgi:chemotaxis protein methyltransferase CheR